MKRFVKLGLLMSAALCPLMAEAQLSDLSDEFEDSGTLSDWQRVNVTEGWNADQLEQFDIGATRQGWMTMVPYTSSWYQNWRGVLAYKEVTGNFAVTTSIHARNRANNAAPNIDYSLAGIMVRMPRNITPATWTAGGENYIFLSIGSANSPGNFQFEVKTTFNSNSNLEIGSAPGGDTEIRSVRLGQYFILLRRPEGEEWQVHRRYTRTDMPATLQVGLTCYTDWPGMQNTDPFTHNGTVYTTGNPDLLAQFDYVRYTEVTVPAEFQGQNLANPSAVTDGQLLSFLGDALDQQEPAEQGTNWQIH